MPNTSIYKIQLTPLGKFFFGGEIVLGGDGAQDERQRSYLVHSEYFPQQTSVLGMLRENLLRENNLLLNKNSSSQQRTDAAQIVGKTGFGIQIAGNKAASTNPNGFGAIKYLSPVFLEDDKGNVWQPAPLDDALGKDDAPLQWQEESPFLLKNFDAKMGLSSQLTTAQNNRKAVTDFFKSQHQVGITVTNRRNWRANRASDDEAFFRQTHFRNADSAMASNPATYSFVCWVSVDDAIAAGSTLWQNCEVLMGGERSAFKLTCTHVADDQDLATFCFPVAYKHNLAAPTGYTRLVLLSDTYIPSSTLKNYRVFPVAETIGFRFFTTHLDTTNDFFELKKGGKDANGNPSWNPSGRQQSSYYSLLRRGGVLLVPDRDVNTLKQEIINQSAFHQIGYNYIQ